MPQIKAFQIESGQVVFPDSNGLLPIELSKISTGTFSGGEITFGTLTGSPGTTTKISVSAGSGIIVDNYTDPENPTYQLVTWGAFTDVEITAIATHPRTFVAIDTSGSPTPNIIQQTTEFTAADLRDYIKLGNVGHINNTNVVAVRNDPVAAFDVTARLGDMARAIGAFNISGNVYGPNGTNLLLNKSAGTSYRAGNNFHINRASPDITADSLETGLEFNYSYQDGAGGYILTAKTNTIDPDAWDDGDGGLGTVGANTWTVQTIKHFTGGAGHRIEYGQETYATQADALNAVPETAHLHNPDFAEGIIRAYLIVRGGASDLSSTSDAIFLEAAKFAGTSGGTSPAPVGESYELQIATGSPLQTVFDLGFTFAATSGGRTYIQVFVDGVKQTEGASYDYTITGTAQITFNEVGSPLTSPFTGGEKVEFYGL